ncbi:MAG: hypothetical protein IT569_09770 [Leptospiraceae bacterium]|nr:hypothetical protein [Leptospiraceae bacterium]
MMIKLTGNPSENRQELFRFIPPESDISVAKAKMEKAGFTCTEQINGEFLDHKNLDYVYCDLEKSKGFLISERWQVALVHKNSKITEIYSSYGLTGP